MARVALYGGSFDPFHICHQLVVSYVLGIARVNQVIVAPCHTHAFGKKMAPFNDRLAMARLGVEMFGFTQEPGYIAQRVVVSDIEKHVAEEYGVNYTIHTVEKMLSQYNDTIVLVLGSDIAQDLHKWMHFDRLKALEDAGKLEFFFVNRSGFSYEDVSKVQMPSVSSTAIREAIGFGKSIDEFVPANIVSYIKEKNLYY